MSDDPTKSRKFLLRDERGKNVDVEAHVGRHFSITCQNGAAHEMILAAATPEVRADIEALVAVHLCDADGTPMHAIENASYYLRDSKFDQAAAALHSPAPVEELYVVFGEATRTAADPRLVEEYLKAPIAAAARYVRLMEQKRSGERMFVGQKESKELVDAVAAAVGRRKLDDAEIAQVAMGQIDEPTRGRIVAAIRNRVFRDAVAAYVEKGCRAVWKERAEAARAALARPDYRAEGRPPIDRDPTTFRGFAAKWGLTLDPGPASRMTSAEAKAQNWPDTARKWTLTIHGRDGKTMRLPFSRGNPETPDLDTVLECLQSEYCSVLSYDRDEWLAEFFNGDVATIRRGESAYDDSRDVQIPAFMEVAGEDALRELLTSVGDNPPMDAEDFAALMARRAPAPGL